MEGLPGVLGNKGTLAKYRREQGNISQFLGTGERNSKNYSTKTFGKCVGTWEHRAILEGNKGTRTPPERPSVWERGIRETLELLQRRASRIFYRTSKELLRSEIMERLGWKSLSSRREPGGGRYSQKKLGRGVRPASQNPYPIYDQNLRFSLPYL